MRLEMQKNKPIISDNFTIEDIHKIREYNHEVTKNMSFEERRKYYANGANNFKKLSKKHIKKSIAKEV
jgi:hypothetical protein